MTIVVAIRTNTAAVLAADSKVTTQAPAGKNPDGTLHWVLQTYDQAVKIVFEQSGTAIAAFAGAGSIGRYNAADYFSRLSLSLAAPAQEQDGKVQAMAKAMAEERRVMAEALQIDPAELNSTVVIVAAPPTDQPSPRVWRVVLEKDTFEVTEILKLPGMWFEGSYEHLFRLFYEIGGNHATAFAEKLGIDEKTLAEKFIAVGEHRAIQQINFWVMPVQDAIDLAVFCAKLQIQMERFLPGVGACGGPIDIMTLEMAPTPRIRAFPGKALHHPDAPDRP